MNSSQNGIFKKLPYIEKRWDIGAIWVPEMVITRAIVDAYFCRHIASLYPNELSSLFNINAHLILESEVYPIFELGNVGQVMR